MKSLVREVALKVGGSRDPVGREFVEGIRASYRVAGLEGICGGNHEAGQIRDGGVETLCFERPGCYRTAKVEQPGHDTSDMRHQLPDSCRVEDALEGPLPPLSTKLSGDSSGLDVL